MSSPDSRNGFFPDDLVLQILARLPIKSLLRFRSVCKFWSTLPSDDHFVRLHSLISSRNPLLLIEILEPTMRAPPPPPNFVCVDQFSGFSDLSLGFLNDSVKVRASCNGLLCCASAASRGLFYVCNPMTGDFKALPRTRERPFSRCQPDYEATLVGLAADHRKFNVVLAGFYRPFGHRPLDQLVCMVFDSEANEWTRLVWPHCDEFTHMNRNQVVFSSGALHWLTHSYSYLLAFDMGDGAWGKISMPDEVVAATRAGARVYLVELEGSISVIQISGVWMHTWVLKDRARELWVLFDEVHLRCIRGVVASVFPVMQTRDVVFLASQKSILTYRRKDKVWREIYAVKGSYPFPLWFSAYPFKGTLFSCH